MDPLDSLHLALDTSLRLARELQKAGAEIFVTTINKMGWTSGRSSAHAFCAPLTFPEVASAPGAEGSMQFSSGSYGKVSLADFSGIHMRKDPPFDLEYVSATWLLESAAGKSKIYNDPAALRSINEKLAIFSFPEAAAAALVSADPEELLQFIEAECSGDAVIKPLLLFGGRGVFRLELAKTSREKALTLLTAETANSTTVRLAQPFNKAIFDGEVRAFALAGKPLAWCLKKPAPGNFLANTRAGAVLAAHQPTAQEVAVVSDVASRLYSAGVVLVGFDLIGGVLSEVNITSPRLLQAPTDTHNYYESMANWIFEDCRSR